MINTDSFQGSELITKGVEISYKPVAEIPVKIGDAVEFIGWAAPGVAEYRGTKLLQKGKLGVYFVKDGSWSGLVYSEIKNTPSGYIVCRGKKAVCLLNAVGTVLSGGDCEDVTDVGMGLYAAKKNKLWAFFRAEDNAQLTEYIYTSVSEFSGDVCVVGKPEGLTLIDAECRQVLDRCYQVCNPFCDDIALVGEKNNLSYITRDGRVIYSGAFRGSRSFCNGYAVISNKKGRLGAIDVNGKVVIEPQYLYMKDSGFGKFVVSNTGEWQLDGKTFKGRNYGLVGANGRTYRPLIYSNVELLPDGGCKYGVLTTWSYTEGNTRYTLGVLVFGIDDADGNEVLPQKFVGIGEESEGLRAFKTYYDNKLSFGYMNEKGEPEFIFAESDYSGDYGSKRTEITNELKHQLGPFKDGRAQVMIRQSSIKTGIFNTNDVLRAVQCPAYYIDRTGLSAASQEKLPEVNAFNPLMVDGLPFHDICMSINKKIKTINAFSDTAIHLEKMNAYAFGDGYIEVDYGYGFAILDKDHKPICASYEGPSETDKKNLKEMTECAKPSHPINSNAKGKLTLIAENVWLDERSDCTKLHISEFESPVRFSNGLAPFRAANGLWGYMDCKGTTAIEPKYSSVSAFMNGYARALRDGKECILFRDSEFKTLS